MIDSVRRSAFSMVIAARDDPDKIGRTMDRMIGR